MGHEIVIEIRGEELRNGRILRNPSHAGIPSVKRHQRHHAIDENEYETDQRQRIANLPRNTLDQSQQSRQNQLDPNQAKDAPEEHVFAGCTPVNRKPLPRVIPCANTERGLFLGDKNSVVMGGFDVIQRASDNAKYTQFYSKNSRGDIASLAAVTYEDGTRELVADSPLQINDIQIKQVVDGGRRVIVLSGARGKEGYSFRFSPDTGEAYMDGRVIHAKADTAGYADTAGSAPANGGTAWAANRLRREGGVDTVWNWAGQGGQPGWLWGGNDGVNMYVYNPSNFSVNYANSAGGARTVSINYAAYNDFPLNANFTMPFDGLAVIFVTGSGWGHIKLFVNGAEVSRARMYGEDSANPCDSPSAFVRSGIVVQGQVNGSRISGVVRCFPGA